MPLMIASIHAADLLRSNMGYVSAGDGVADSHKEKTLREKTSSSRAWLMIRFSQEA